MSDYDYDGFEDEPPTQDASGPTLPGGISLQAAAALLLVAVLIATLYLFFGPEPETAIAPADGGSARATSTIVTSATGSAPTSAASSTSIAAVTVASPTSIGGVISTSSTPTMESAGAGASSVTPVAIPGSLAEGGFVEVVNTEGFNMRYRFGPGPDTATIRIVEEGEILRVSGGPEEADGMMWWRLQDRFGNVGWAAADFLSPTAPQTGWNPPPASPTFESPAP